MQRLADRVGRRRGFWGIKHLTFAAAVMLFGATAALAQSNPAFPATPTTGTADTGTANANQAANTTDTATVPAIAPPARAPDTLFPRTGNTAEGGGLRDAATTSLARPLEPTARNWAVTPSLGLGEEYTSNVLATTGNGRGYDIITLVQPGVTLSGTSTRLQGSFGYHPEVDIYARNFDQSRVNQNFDGSVLATLLPGTVFLDLRTFGAVTTNGVNGTAGTSTAQTNGQTQSLDFAANPYAVHRFGPWGSGEIGVGLERSSSNAVAGSYTATTNPYFTSGNQDLTTYSGHIGFQTGEEFERYNGSALLFANQYDGTGVLASSARDTATLDNGYGVSRFFTLLGRIGYEHIRYSGTSPVRIDDEIWDGGFRLTLGPSSSIEARYGHHDGFNSLSAKGGLQPTARTRFYVEYSEGLDTDAEQLQNGLATSDFDQLGNPVDHTTGAPLLLATGGFFGAQNNLYRTQRLSVTGTLLETVDVFSATVEAENNRLVSSSGLVNSLGSNKGIYGSLNWAHELSPTLSLTSFGQYGIREATQQDTGTQHEFSASVALAKLLSETLSVQLRYSYNRSSGGQNGQNSSGSYLTNFDQSLVLLSATKSF